MKRSTGSPINFPSSKRFESMRSSPQMQLQQQYYQQMQHIHHYQQQQNTAPFSAPLLGSQSYLPSMTTATPGIIPFSNPAQSSFLTNYNNDDTSNMWNYQNMSSPSPLSYNVAAQTPRKPVPTRPLTINQQFTKGLLPSKPAAVLKKSKHVKDSIGKYVAKKLKAGVSPKLNKNLKRKSISSRLGHIKVWNREDALKALAIELEYNKTPKTDILLLRFPDPELNRNIVSEYSQDIEAVHFQYNAAPRFCFVNLKEGADTAKVIETISKIPFGNGFIKVELKRSRSVDPTPENPEEIDPYTLYVGNLPSSITTRTVKEHFPGAQRIDIGYAQRMKNSRYAFIRYKSIEESLNAYRNSVNKFIETRQIMVRFRRQKNNTMGQASTTISADCDVQNDTHSIAEINETNADRNIVLAEEERLPNCTRDVSCILNNGNLDILEVDTSLTSLDQPLQPELEYKSRVLEDAESFRRVMSSNQSIQRSNRRSSIEEMFEELERRQRLLETDKPSSTERLKDELNTSDDLSEDEEELQSNLLGSRYENDEQQIKDEPDSSPHNNENSHEDETYQEESDCDELFNAEKDDDHLPDITLRTNNASGNCNHSARNSLLEPERKREILDVKPDMTNLLNNTNSSHSVYSDTHALDVERLYEQRRKFLRNERSSKTHDDLDDMFAEMNSDFEDDDLY